MDKRIPLQALACEYLQHRDSYSALFDRVCTDAAFCDGSHVHRFERDFAAFCGVRAASAVNNGTNALVLALKILGVQPGDEVLLPAATFVSTAWAVLANGATPVFADIAPDSWELDPADAARRLTKRTKLLLGVHLYGNLCDVAALQALAEGAGIPFVEDAAQAHGAELGGKRAGAFGKIGCFSFYPTKNLGAFGEGGCLVSDDEALMERAAFLKKHAQTPSGDHTEFAFNMRMEGLQGAVLAERLPRLEAANARRREIARLYRTATDGTRLQPQAIRPGVTPAYHLFVVQADDRRHFMQYMDDRGIDTGIHYALPCHLQTAFNRFGYRAGSLPQTEQLCAHCVSVPLHPYMSETEIARVADALAAYQ